METLSQNFGASDAYTILLSYEAASQDAAANRTSIRFLCTLRSNRASATFTGQARGDTLVVGGFTQPLSHGAYTVPGGGSVLLWEAVLGFSHDPDGTFSRPLSLSVGIGTSFSSSGYIDAVTLSGTLTLPAIPRASSLACGSLTMGKAAEAVITAADPSFRHDLSLTAGGLTKKLLSRVAGGSHSVTAALGDFGPKAPNATSLPATLTLVTYDGGGAWIGEKALSLTLYVPATAAPSISSFSVQMENPAAAGDWGIAIQGVTKLQWAAAAAGAYGSTIVSARLSGSGLSGSGLSGLSAPLSAAGNVTPTLTVTDSRGRTAQKRLAALPVLAYAPPSLTASAGRCTPDGGPSEEGTHCLLSLSASCVSLGSRNSLSLSYRRQDPGGSFSAWLAAENGQILEGFSLDGSYTLEVRALDTLGSARTVRLTVPAASAALHLREGGKGAAFGKYAESDGLLDTAWDARVRGDLTVDGGLLYGGKTHHAFTPIEQGGGPGQGNNKINLGWGEYGGSYRILAAVDGTSMGPLAIGPNFLNMPSTTVYYQNANVKTSAGAAASIALRIYKYGRIVFCSMYRTPVLFSEANTAYSDEGLIPSAYRPIQEVRTAAASAASGKTYGSVFATVMPDGTVWLMSERTAIQEAAWSACWISAD